MRSKRFTVASAVAAFVLVGGLSALTVGAPAFADDAPPTDTSSAAPVVPAPDPSPAPADPAPSTDATDPAPAPVVPPTVFEVTPAPDVVIVTPPADPFVAVLWATDVYGVKYGQHIVSITHEATETLTAIPSTCGTSYQSDVYNESAGLEALLNNGAGVLAGPDGAQDGSFLADGGQGIAYNYVVNDACPPPPPAGITCAAIGTSYTEDVDWTATVAGEQLAGPTTAAIDHYYGVTGNLQGLTNLSITETTTGTGNETALAVVEVNPHGSAYPGGPAISYETISPVGPNADGTTNELTGLLYSSKIPYANEGGQGDPQPISWFVTNQPNNTLISVGVHLQTNSTANTSVVSALDAGCVTESYVAPTVTFPDGSQTGPTCVAPTDGSTANGGWYTLPVLPSTEKYALQSDGSRPVAGMFPLQPGQTVTVTAHTLASAFVQPGSRVYTFTGAAEIPSQSTNADAPCYVAVVVTPPTTPSTPTLPAKVLGYTGDNTPYIPIGLAAALIVGVGAALVIARRKERAAE